MPVTEYYSRWEREDIVRVLGIENERMKLYESSGRSPFFCVCPNWRWCDSPSWGGWKIGGRIGENEEISNSFWSILCSVLCVVRASSTSTMMAIVSWMIFSIVEEDYHFYGIFSSSNSCTALPVGIRSIRIFNPQSQTVKKYSIF